MASFDVTFSCDDNSFLPSFDNVIKGDRGEPGATYDDTALSNRVTALENTIGTLNDSLEGVLKGNGTE